MSSAAAERGNRPALWHSKTPNSPVGVYVRVPRPPLPTPMPDESPTRAERRLAFAAEALSWIGFLWFLSSWIVVEQFRIPPGDTSLALGVWIFVAFVAVALLAVSRNLKEKGMRLRAERIRACARTDGRPPFIILRSFKEGPLTSRPKLAGPRGRTRYGHAFAHDIGEALGAWGRLIAIGGDVDLQNYYRGSDVIYVQSRDETWFQMFANVLAGVRAVIVIPGLSEGLLREMRAIAQLRAWDRVLVFMAPDPAPDRDYKFLDWYADDRAAEKEWEKVRQMWNELGYALPAHQAAGMLYAAASGFSVAESVSLEHDVLRLPDTLALLLKRHSSPGKPVREILPLLEADEAPPLRPDVMGRLLGVG